MQTKSILTVLTAVAALGLAGMSQAAVVQSDDIPTVTVQYADLNLASAAGAKAMLQRIRHAAKSVCGPEPTSGIERVSGPYSGCLKDAVRGAVAKLNSPMVTALYSGRGSAPTTLASAR